MIKASEGLQELSRRIYTKAKTDKRWKRWSRKEIVLSESGPGTIGNMPCCEERQESRMRENLTYSLMRRRWK